MIKIYTHYSDTHKKIYESFFKRTLRNLYSKEEVLIKAAYHKQTTQTGLFMEPGWNDAMRIKLEIILQAIEDKEDDMFIFSDVDVVFYAPFINDLKQHLSNCDIALQEDCGSMCAGFFIAKKNQKVKDLFNRVYNNFTTMVNDQVALNHLKQDINYKLLPKTEYYTIGNFFNNPDGTHIWDNKTNIIPPKDIKLHHANYVKGVTNKINLIEMIKNNYDKIL